MPDKSPWPQYAKTIPELFFERSGKWANEPLFRYKEGGDWVDVTWKEAEENLLAIASGLIALGIEAGSAVAILSTNRPEWAYADLGCLAAGILDVPIYPTNTAEQVQFILEDSGAVAVFVENQMQLDKVIEEKRRLPNVKKAIVFEPRAGNDDFVIDLSALMELGREKMDRAAIDKRWKGVDPEDVATLIYTSGTTGNPKGVMLLHRNLASNIVGLKDFLNIEAGMKDLQFLPLCHSFGRMEMYGLMMYNALICFAESIDKIPDNFKSIQPDLFITVPRLLEKVYSKIMSGVEAGPGLKKKLFGWALGVGRERNRYRQAGEKIPAPVAAQFAIADKLVFSKIKAALGGRLVYLVYGAAPLSREIEEFFASTGINVLGAYGLTETSPGITGNFPDNFRIGSVGKPWSDTEIKIDEDGEILVRGPQVMKGYWNRPDANAEAFTEDGFFRTGDIGEIDDDGFIWITDRKKDIIVTAGGKNVAPQNIENLIKTDDAIEQLAVIGDQKKYLVALIVPDFEWLVPWAKAEGISGAPEDLIKNDKVRAEFERRIAEKNKQLAKYETIKKFELLPEAFAVENNMLTPTLKVRRKNVMQHYGGLIESMYPKD